MQLAGGCREMGAKVTGVTACKAANMRLLRVWGDFHSGEIRGVLCLKLWDRGGLL